MPYPHSDRPRHLPPPWRLSARRPLSPLTDAEWAALVPYVGDHLYAPVRDRAGRRRAGRPLSCDPRARFEAMLRGAVTGTPWHRLGDGRGGKGATVGRHFARLAHAGLWTRLLGALADPRLPPVLRAMEYWLCRLARRAMRTLGARGLDLASRLGLATAMPMWPRFLPSPDLSRIAASAALAAAIVVDGALRADRLDLLPRPGLLARIGRLLRASAGRRSWSRRLAPP